MRESRNATALVTGRRGRGQVADLLLGFFRQSRRGDPRRLPGDRGARHRLRRCSDETETGGGVPREQRVPFVDRHPVGATEFSLVGEELPAEVQRVLSQIESRSTAATPVVATLVRQQAELRKEERITSPAEGEPAPLWYSELRRPENVFALYSGRARFTSPVEAASSRTSPCSMSRQVCRSNTSNVTVEARLHAKRGTPPLHIPTVSTSWTTNHTVVRHKPRLQYGGLSALDPDAELAFKVDTRQWREKGFAHQLPLGVTTIVQGCVYTNCSDRKNICSLIKFRKYRSAAVAFLRAVVTTRQVLNQSVPSERVVWF